MKIHHTNNQLQELISMWFKDINFIENVLNQKELVALISTKVKGSYDDDGNVSRPGSN